MPTILVSRDELRQLVLDARARFVLGFVDDRTGVFDLIQSTGLPLEEAAAALRDLYDLGVVGLAEPA